MPEKQIPLIWTLAQIASIWVAAEVGYHIVLPGFGFPTSYSNNPIGIAVYYSFWIIVSVMTFWHAFKGWRPVRNRLNAYMFLTAAFSGLAAFTIYFLPQQNAWYFLPKSIDILLQQILIAAMVRAFSAQNFGLRAITLWCVFLFGGAHLFLVFWGLPVNYVIQFTASAMMFALIFPHLMLNVPNGLAYSYILQWIYYMVMTVMMHSVSPFAA